MRGGVELRRQEQARNYREMRAFSMHPSQVDCSTGANLENGSHERIDPVDLSYFEPYCCAFTACCARSRVGSSLRAS
jgi:hypothetical protein